MNNARADSVATKPSFRSAFRSRRVLIPATGFYEWKRDVQPKAQPYYIRPTAEPLFTFAGVCQAWRDPGKADDDPDRWVMTCAIITTDASDELSWMHDRMPAFVPADLRDVWLDHDADLDDLRAILADGPRQVAAQLETYPVSYAVNNARNQGPELIKPLEPTGT